MVYENRSSTYFLIGTNPIYQTSVTDGSELYPIGNLKKSPFLLNRKLLKHLADWLEKYSHLIWFIKHRKRFYHWSQMYKNFLYGI